MTDFLLKNAETLLTMDDDRRVLKSADIRVRDGVIVEIGQGLQGAEATVDASGTL